MKPYFKFLLFVAFTAILYLLLTVSFCKATEITVEVTAEVRAKPLHITVSEPFSGSAVKFEYPPLVYLMTDGVFYAWATEQNAKARTEWEEWFETAPPRWTSYGTTTDYEQRRRGGFFGSNYERGSVCSYEKRYLNPHYVSRPLTIINPYCRPTAEEVK